MAKRALCCRLASFSRQPNLCTCRHVLLCHEAESRYVGRRQSAPDTEFSGANVVAYIVLPVATPTARFIHFRHAVLAAMMAHYSFIDRLLSHLLAKVASGLVGAVAVLAQANTCFHRIEFEREA